jgi:hypothetical protein
MKTFGRVVDPIHVMELIRTWRILLGQGWSRQFRGPTLNIKDGPLNKKPKNSKRIISSKL